MAAWEGFALLAMYPARVQAFAHSLIFWCLILRTHDIAPYTICHCAGGALTHQSIKSMSLNGITHLRREHTKESQSAECFSAACAFRHERLVHLDLDPVPWSTETESRLTRSCSRQVSFRIGHVHQFDAFTRLGQDQSEHYPVLNGLHILVWSFREV